MRRFSSARFTKWISAATISAGALLLSVAPTEAVIQADVTVDYDATSGELPEGVAVDKRGDVFVGLAPLGEIRKIARDGSESTLATIIPPGAFPGVLGLALDARGNVYAGASTGDAATTGIYKIARDGTFERLPGSEVIAFPNGIAFDKRGNIYVTDTAVGLVWRIPARGGPPEIWFQSPLLQGDGSFGFPFPIGANGIAFRHNSLVVANSEGARLVRISIEPDGTAGAATVLAEDPALSGADGIAFDIHGNVWVAAIVQSTIVRVSPAGDVETIATSADGLDFASSIAFGKGTDLWVVNFAIGPPGGLGPALLRFDAGAKGQPLP